MTQDRKGRRRAAKSRRKRPVFIALGIWPDSGQALVLDWMVGESEEAGLRREQGLRLLIHDGGSGLCAALQTVHFGVPYQRCLFHKLRNIADAIELPIGLTRSQRTQQRKAILQPFRDIWQAKRWPTLLRRYLQVVRDFVRRNTRPSLLCAVISARRLPSSPCLPTTRLTTCAPPAVSNGSTAPCAPACVWLLPFIPMPASMP